MSHTLECTRARGGAEKWPLMVQLTVDEQQAVFDCPDPSHEATRIYLAGRPIEPPLVIVR